MKNDVFKALVARFARTLGHIETARGRGDAETMIAFCETAIELFDRVVAAIAELDVPEDMRKSLSEQFGSQSNVIDGFRSIVEEYLGESTSSATFVNVATTGHRPIQISENKGNLFLF